MYFHSDRAGLIAILYYPYEKAYYLYISGELWDTSGDAHELRDMVETHRTGNTLWDGLNEPTGWIK